MHPSDLSPTAWDARYRSADIPWDMGRVSPPLCAFYQQGILPKGGRVLLPGCGSGHEVLYLARLGYEAIGADFAPAAVEAATRLLEGTPKGRAICVDVMDGKSPDWGSPFDWAFDQTFFCAIDPRLRDQYAEAMSRLIRPGGEIWVLSFRVPGRIGPPFDSTPDELIERLARAGFSPLECRLLDEESHPARRGRESLVRMIRE